MIEVNQLTRRFDGRTAVDQLSFSARAGEVVGLLGPNGAGKTTTIRLLSTVLAATSGSFQIAGVPSAESATIRRKVGVLPESAGYPSYLSGRDYLRYHGRLFGLARPAANDLAERLLTEVGLADRASSRIGTYSRGMRQRLGIARSLINDPVVVLLDEPTLGLDPAGQKQILAIVRQIASERSATVVLSTHTLPEVEQVCSSVLILANGRVLVSGTVDEVTRAVAVQRSGRLRVPLEDMARARETLAAVPGVDCEATPDRPDTLAIRVTGSSASDTNAALLAVLAADVPVLSFEVDGARLNDAFLALTSQARS
ncbi:ABC transporter ATP-binding protein [Kibdelosporangium aridum]|uniref:ABC transporter ATP-binding protein n=1 Tax=Kibdelosporangium aridum TaxID=2030 RepID=A0A428ZC02_KIBAR|nr:ABC transporter ATP-binding protein [Kibdelosporangium aridum]RSM85510.1 ABC transporter ATP-binding protein [Kibdelosporangium aridum]